MGISLDATDRAILRLLRLDARRSNADIAAEVGLSASSCHRRIKLLERNGAISGYTIVPGKMDGNHNVNILVQVTLERQTEDYLVRFEAAVRRYPEVKDCYLMTGEVDYWLRVECESIAAYEQLHGEVLSRLPGVTRINSSVAMRDAHHPRRTNM